MKGVLDKNKIDYVLFHLKHHINYSEELFSQIEFLDNSNKADQSYSDKILFLLTEEALDEKKVLWINKIPVLFPLSDKQEHYYFDDSGNLIFSHDLLKSVFYLLSGYQETQDYTPDYLGRFPYNASIQHGLKITALPIVNYYFQIIIDGFKLYCKKNNIEFNKKEKAVPFTFVLSHDVDNVDKYDFYQTAYLLKQTLGLAPSVHGKMKLIKKFAFSAFQWLRGKNRLNPWWNFEELRAVEEECNIKSTFYFLPKHELNVDAYYSFGEPRIKQLIAKLDNEGCEIGFHAPVAAHIDKALMQAKLKELANVSKQEIVGNRQHTLANKYPETQIILQECGLLYDTTLGYADHEGFRNSYCHPFHTFDFENNKMMELWELPLVLMDCTLFKYRNLSIAEAEKKAEQLIAETEKFNGVFSLLWHNSYFEEDEVPGIKAFYYKLLKTITQKGSENITAKECITQFQKS